MAGIIIPLVSMQRNEDKVYQSIQQNDSKVDQAILKMEGRFKELAGEQLRRPQITCEFAGKPLLNANVSCVPWDRENPSDLIWVRNTGDRSTGEVRLYLRLASPPDETLPFIATTEGAIWPFGRWEDSDDPAYASKFLLHTKSNLQAKQAFAFRLGIQGARPPKIVPAILEVFYDAPEPLKVPFTIRLVERKANPARPSDANNVK